MAYFLRLSRQEFVAWLGNERLPDPQPIKRAEDIPHLSDHEVVLFWHGEYVKAPLIIIEDRSLSDFLAFISTYVSTYSPFTAFFRVVSTATLPIILSPSINLRTAKFPRELIAVTVAEAAAQMGVRNGDFTKISSAACRATLSFSMLAALSLGYGADHVSGITEKWSVARRGVGDDRLRLSVASINEFWMTVASALAPAGRRSGLQGEKKMVVEFVKSVLSDGIISDRLWQSVSGGVLGNASLAELLQGSREQRIRQLDHFTQSIFSADQMDRSRRDLLLGFVTALFAQGSFRYFEMVSTPDPSSTARLWFAFFSGIQKGNDVLDYAGGLGRHVGRDLPDSGQIETTPDADISFEELMVIYGERLPQLPFRTRLPSNLIVELFPGVNGIFPVRSARQDDVARQEIVPRMRELRSVLNHARHIVESLQIPEIEQTDLFDNSNSTRNTRRRDK